MAKDNKKAPQHRAICLPAASMVAGTTAVSKVSSGCKDNKKSPA